MKFRIVIILLVLNTLIGYGNHTPRVSLSRVSPEGGIVYSQTTCIAEDDLGFIWFGTNSGLFFYNSLDIKRYSHNQNDSCTIPSNRINTIYNDYSGKLWIATENGLCRYNEKLDNFNIYNITDQFKRPAGKNINSFFQANDSTFWLADENGFGKLYLNTNTVVYTNINSEISRVRKIAKDDNENIWVFYANGEIFYQTKGSNNFQYFNKGLPNVIRSVLIDSNNVWIAYQSNGILSMSLDGEKTIHFSNKNTDNTTLPSNQVRSIIKANENQIWAGTYNGIAIIENYKIVSVVNELKYSELPNHSIWSLFKDSKENIWIGSFHGGICFHSAYNNSFSHYSQSSSNTSSSSSIISSFANIQNENTLIFGTEDGNLNYLYPETGVVKTIPVEYQGKKVENIKSISIDKDGTLWVGTYHNGILFKSKFDDNFKLLQTPFSTNDQILDMHPTENGIWFCKFPEGICFYDFESKKFANYRHNPLVISSISSDFVRKMLEDKEGNMWFATQNGLNLLKKGSREFTHYFHNKAINSISSNFIFTMHEDTKGNLWLGTNGQGLDKFNPKTNVFESYTTDDGLPGNEIFSILEDDSLNIWVATNNGLCKLNPETKNIELFNNSKGIQNNRFNPNAAISTLNGELVFGGTNGFIQFLPEEIRNNPIAPATVITEFYVNNKLILPKDQNDILVDVISNTSKVKLNYKQSSFNFHFVANNFINPSENRFKYRLIGFNNEWNDSDINRATFTNITPGKYIFEVKAANNSEVWNNIPTKISITITPPLWKTLGAKLFYLVFILFVILYSKKEFLNRQKLKNDLKLGVALRDKEKQMHQMKLQFFTNVSHEFRTPLTLINGPINRILKADFDKQLSKKQFAIIKNNTDRLLRLVNQILDFRKIDSGKLILNPVHGDIVIFCKNVYSCFEEHAKHRAFTYKFETEIPSLNMDFDQDKLDKILFNLLSNAFKYTPNGGNITIRIKSNTLNTDFSHAPGHIIGDEIEDDYINISIYDDGKGIPAKKLTHIFDRFYQIDNNSMQGTGIGLSLSETYIALHKGQLAIRSEEKTGSIFSLYLPQHQPESIHANRPQEIQLPNYETHAEESYTSTKKVNVDKEKTLNQEALVLIAEDNPDLLNYMGEVLQEHFRVAKTQNGKEALEQAHSLFPDIIISDIMMPEMDGIELCATLKKDIRTSHIPIILLTALNTVKDRISGIDTGADAYMAKPFDDDLLITQINNLLNSRKILRESFSSENNDVQIQYEALDMDKKFLLRAIQVVEQNLTDDGFSVEDLAKNLHLSRTHLHRKLKSLTNQSATEFIRHNRLKQAVKLMKERKLSLSEVGYAVGFNTPNYFTTSFKKQFGKSPSEFMKEDLNQFEA